MIRKDLRAYLGLAAILAAQTVTAANAETQAIKKISVNEANQLVVEFSGAAFPAAPHVLDLPGPNHRVVFDFTDASLDKNSLPTADELSGAVSRSLPFVKSVRYSNLENAPAPTARVVLDVPQDLKFKPRVVKVEQGTITINLGDNLPGASAKRAVAPAPAETPVGEEVAAAPAPAETPVGEEVAAAPAPAETPVGEEVAAAPAPAETPVGEEVAAAPTPAETPVGEEVAAAPTPGETPVGEEVAAAPTPGETPVGEEVVAPAHGETPVAEAAPDTESGTTAAVEETARPVASTAVTAPVETAPTSEADKKLASIKKYNAAVQAHLHGKLVEAIANYRAALEFNPKLAEAHSNLGLIYNQQHNYAQALSEFRKALAINPRDAITYNGIGAALRAEKDLQGAIKNWQTAVSLDDKLATAHYNLGTAYEIAKEYDKALDSYNAAVKNDYRLGEAYYRMGLIMERKRRPDDAAAQFKEALKVSADSEYSEDARQRLAFLTKNKSKVK